MAKKENRCRFPSDVRNLGMDLRRKAYSKAVERGEWQDSLSTRISAGLELKECEIDNLLSELAHGCRKETKARLRHVFLVCPNIDSYGIYERILFNGERATYCAGQDSTSEIATVRKLLLKG